MVVSHLMWVLGTKFGSSGRAANALNCWAYPAPLSTLDTLFLSDKREMSVLFIIKKLESFNVGLSDSKARLRLKMAATLESLSRWEL